MVPEDLDLMLPYTRPDILVHLPRLKVLESLRPWATRRNEYREMLLDIRQELSGHQVVVRGGRRALNMGPSGPLAAEGGVASRQPGDPNPVILIMRQF